MKVLNVTKYGLCGIVLGTGLLLGGAPAKATAVTVTLDGSYSFSYSGSAGNAPAIADVLSNPFSETLALNTPTSLTDFISVTPATCYSGTPFYGYCFGGNGTATGTITATFTFTEPKGATGNFTDTGTYTADYNNDTDSVKWSSSNDPIAVTFADGAVVDVSLDNASDWTIFPTISFDLVKDPVPEPFSLALLGSGLVGLGIARRKRMI